ncbi:hypothetical protein [Pseudonocardia acidicola]|uniref:N-6 DNA methylase n=1 Tax=Pseudonocardia acidicola TaxID=2724939 RepID=A0ABX1S8U4_9PSEU|nr:hypothetical protein [Pseudonocardia acidicola]NMH97986.1 hypothetical protein [Pseudonocardia acidicola]
MADTLYLGLADVALLARVRRAPVTMWRRRYASTATPFPQPVATRGAQQLFDGDEVVTWLETTGRGNNPAAREDLAGFAVLADTDLDDPVIFAGLTALLCLSRYTDGLSTVHDDLLDEADEADPDDEFLTAELEALGERLVPLARYCSLRIDAAYHAGAAFEGLMARRRRRARDGYTRTALSAPAVRLVAALVNAIGTDAGINAPLIVDPTGGGGDLLVELARDEGRTVSVALPPGDAPERRLTRRRLRVRGIDYRTLEIDGDGGVVVPEDGVVVLQLPGADDPDAEAAELLQTAEEVLLGNPADRRMVIVGRASTLTEGLPRSARRVRDDIVRTHRLRGIARLPAGLAPFEPRARVALWCVGPAPTMAPGGVPPRTMVVNLSDTELDDIVTADLVTDLVAGMQDVRGQRAHLPRFGRLVGSVELITRLGGLVDAVPTPQRTEPAVEVLARISELRAELAERLAPAAMPGVVARSAPPGTRHTLDDALRSGMLRLLPGHRLDRDLFDAEASVRVLGPPELLGTSPPRSVDRLLLAARHEVARFTEPGDVVFCTAPRPAAVVDVEGGAVVVHPARVLRSKSSELPPRVVAAAISAQPADARAWGSWTVGSIPADQADSLRVVLDELDSHRAALKRRLDAVDTLASTLTDGTASGILDLSQHD